MNVPLPPLQADRSPAGVARGAAIFHSTCEVCHRAPGSERVSGAPVTDAPTFLGSFHAANLTAHPTAGIGKYSDAELARLVRYGVNRQGHRSLMPTYAMGDADVSALLGFLRSDDPLFRDDANCIATFAPERARQGSARGLRQRRDPGATRERRSGSSGTRDQRVRTLPRGRGLRLHRLSLSGVWCEGAGRGGRLRRRLRVPGPERSARHSRATSRRTKPASRTTRATTSTAR